MDNSEECKNSKDKVYSDTLTKESYNDEHKTSDVWNKKEEMDDLLDWKNQESNPIFESEEEVMSERTERESSPGLREKPSEKTGTSLQELGTESSCQDSDVKPTHSYIALIAMAILSSTSKKMILGDIYEYISDNFPYYRNKDKSWRNSIRHNLSLNECFIKAGRSENGKGNYWAIHPANLEDFANGDFRRRRARRRVRKSSALKFASGTAAYLRSLSMFAPIHHNGLFPYRTSDYQMFSQPYLPAPDKKNLAMEAIMSSYDIPASSLCLSGSTQKSYQPFMGGAFPYGRMLQPYTNSSLMAYTPFAEQQVSSYKAPNSELKRFSDGPFSSAFMPYSTITSQASSSKSESWQETLSKLQEKLKNAT